MWKKVGSGTPVVAFPIYDGHGNMVYTLSRAANETFSLGNKRIYGVWGDLRHDGNPGDGPNTQYCANLGHKKDNESGLTYMRARYYEPWTGRFINEDKARDGWNWYGYCTNNPTNKVDCNGRIAVPLAIWGAITGFLVGFFSTLITTQGDYREALISGIASAVGGALAASVGQCFSALNLKGALDSLAAGLGSPAAGGLGGFVTSILTDIFHGRSPNWGRAAHAAGIGGVTGAVFGVVAALNSNNAIIGGMCGLDADLVGTAVMAGIEFWQ